MLNRIFYFLIIIMLVISLVPIKALALEEVSTDFTITGGELGFQVSSLELGDVNLKSGTVQTTTGTSTLAIDDSRGSGAGWNVKLSATDFITTVSDPSVDVGTVTLSIPASSLLVNPDPLSISGNTDYVASIVGLPLNNTGIDIIEAAPGFGMDKYSIDLNFTLTIPKTGTVESVTGTDSYYLVGEPVGIFQGTYFSTLTYTIGSGL